MLRYLGARCGGNESGAGGDIESMRAVAAGAAGVDEMPVVSDFHRRGELAHHLRRSSDLADRFLLHAQAHDEPGDLRRAELAAHDLAHDVQHLVVEHFPVLDSALDCLRNRDLLHDRLPSMKFCRIWWPCSVSMASGWNWAPSTGSLRWRRPMISPSSDSAVISRQAGSVSRSTTRE